jgi:hypothetical protein
MRVQQNIFFKVLITFWILCFLDCSVNLNVLHSPTSEFITGHSLPSQDETGCKSCLWILPTGRGDGTSLFVCLSDCYAYYLSECYGSTLGTNKEPRAGVLFLSEATPPYLPIWLNQEQKVVRGQNSELQL